LRQVSFRLQELALHAGREQRLGKVWRGGEFFATSISLLTANAARHLRPAAVNWSPDPQVSSPIGELFGAKSVEKPANIEDRPRIIRHRASRPGEECGKIVGANSPALAKAAKGQTRRTQRARSR